MAISEFQVGRLVKAIRAHKLDALLVAPSEDLVCLLGFSPMLCERFQGLFVTAEGSSFYICNLLYVDELAEHLERKDIYSWFDGDGFVSTVQKAFMEKGLLGGRIGVSQSVRAFNALAIAAAMDVTFVDAMTVIHEARMLKTEEELGGLRKAAAIADAAFGRTVAQMKAGMTEQQVKDILFGHMSALGGVNPEGIIASGPNGALPHYMGGGRALQKGDAVVMDFGCTVDNMQSDITRTVFMGPPPQKQQDIYALVLESNLKGEAAVAEGAWIPDVDKAARDVIEQAGYGPYFTARLGHGIGFLIHEAPDIKRTNERALEKGMAFSIEPGIYLAGEFGVRIEDIVCVNHRGDAEILNKAAKEWIVIDN